MAISRDKIVFKFQYKKPSDEKLKERFYRPNLRPIEQNAVAFTKNAELQDMLYGTNTKDNALKQDIEKRLRRALLDKEVAMDKLADANYRGNDDEIEFYVKSIQVLDNLIKDLRNEYERVNLSKRYIDELKPIDYKGLSSKASSDQGEATPEPEEMKTEEGIYSREELAKMSRLELQTIIGRKIKDLPKGTPGRKKLITDANKVKNSGTKDSMRMWIMENQYQ